MIKLRFLFFLQLIILGNLAGCSNPDGEGLITAQPPDSLDGNLFARVFINDGPAQTFYWPDAETTQKISVTGIVRGQENTIRIEWYEIFESINLPLSVQSGSALIGTTDNNLKPVFPHISDIYDYDQDGYSNLEERRTGTCPLQTCSSPPNAPTVMTIAGGTFVMGTNDTEAPAGSGDPAPQSDERPAHTVTISTFEITESEVTRASWKLCVNSGSCSQPIDPTWLPDISNPDAHPIVGVSWTQIQQYIDWLNSNLNETYRLPTEAEFEYALRGGTSTTHFYGDVGGNYCDYANGSHSNPLCQDPFQYTSPVKSFSPNPYGLYDMNGNAAEWTQDCYHENYNGAPTDGSAWLGTDEECGSGAVRGGNFNFVPTVFRITDRRNKSRHPDFVTDLIGFRLVQE